MEEQLNFSLPDSMRATADLKKLVQKRKFIGQFVEFRFYFSVNQCLGTQVRVDKPNAKPKATSTPRASAPNPV